LHPGHETTTATPDLVVTVLDGHDGEGSAIGGYE
jgi:hypothetical protein